MAYNEPKPLCCQYRDGGECSYGSYCLFSHDLDAEQTSCHSENPGGSRPIESHVNVAIPEPNFTAQPAEKKESPKKEKKKNKKKKKKKKKSKGNGKKEKDTEETQSSSHRGSISQQEQDSISAFFAQYPDFPYNDGRGPSREFHRMCDFFAWPQKHPERQRAHQAFKDALVFRFNNTYGKDVNQIENWHKLCVAVSIDPLPESITKCKRKVKKVHVNLVDLVDTSLQHVELFRSLNALRRYTISNGKFFPKKSAHAGGVLKFLLRPILTNGSTSSSSPLRF